MKYLTVVALFLFFAESYAQSTFFRFYDVEGAFSADQGVGISYTQSGDLFVINTSYCPEGVCDYFMHLTPEGENDWTYRHHQDSFVSQTNLGGFMDIYSTAIPGHFQVPMIEYIPRLARRGSSRLTFSENGLEERVFINNDTITDWIRDWNLTDAGHCYLSERPYASEIVYRELDAAGNLLQEYIHTKPEFQRISRGDMQALPDGGYLYAYRYFENFSNQETIFGRRASNGDILWERDDNEPNNSESTGGIERIVMTTDGTVVLSEYMDDYSTPDPITDFNGNFVLRGFAAATGEELWYHVFRMPSNLTISQLIPAANGDVIGTGWRFVQELEGVGDIGYFVGWIFRASSSGEILWERNFTTTSAAIYEPRLQDVVELPDGRIAAVGFSQNGFFSNGFPNLDVWLVVVDENGCLEPGCEDNIVVATREAPSKETALPRVHPNPAHDAVELTLPIDQLTRVDLYNLRGQLLRTKMLRGEAQFPVGDLPRGTIVIRISYADGSSRTEKVLLQ